MQALSDQEIQAELRKHPLWQLEAKMLVRSWQFASFRESIAFVNKIAEEAERADHHPDILVQYSKVKLSLSTHDANGLSERDFQFAKFCDSLGQR